MRNASNPAPNKRSITAMPPLETPRLLLCPLTLDDAPEIQRLFPQWEIVRFLASVVPWPYPPDGAFRFIHDISLPAIARGDKWDWTLRLKSDPDRLIGAISLMKRQHKNRGFWMAPSFQGRGLMSEAADAVTDFWFDVLKMPVLRTEKAAVNLASRRISEKQGMRLVGTVERDYVSGRQPTEIWEITAEEWRARRRSMI